MPTPTWFSPPADTSNTTTMSAARSARRGEERRYESWAEKRSKINSGYLIL